MAEKSRAEKYSELHPEPLTPEWKKNKATGLVIDLKNLMKEMPVEEKAIIIKELQEDKN